MADIPQAAPANTGSDFAERQRYNELYGTGTGASGIGRTESRLIQHQRRKNGKGGTICSANGIKYLDTDSAGAVDHFSRKMEGRAIADVGEVVDWVFRLAVRPTAKGSVASVASYAARSFFINVSDGGIHDSLPQKLIAEMIQVMFELFVDITGIRINNEDPEIAMREGFESQRKKMNRGFNALLNARNNGITESLIEKIDDYFDVAVEAIHKAAEKGELGKISADGVEPLAEEFGRVLAKKLMALSKEEKERLIHDPVAVFDFYNKILRDGGMSFRLKDEATEELRVRQNRLLELEKENAVLRQRDAELRKEAERLREERKKDLNAPRYGDDDLQSETERIRRQRERDNAEYRDTTSAGRDNEDLGDTRRTWKQWALSWVGMGNRR